MSQTFSKISLEKFNPDLDYQDQTCGLSLAFAEEVNDDEGRFQYAKENKAKLKNFFAHNDLLERFNTLRSHLALVCEMNANLKNIGDAEIEQPEILAPRIYATGIVMTGSGENDGVVIIGFKVLAGGARLNLVTPNVTFDEYEHASHLMDLLADIEKEASAAYRGKRKIIQGELFDDGDGEAMPEGGTDDEMNHLTDPIDSIKAMKAGLKKAGMTASISSNGRTVQL